MSMSSVQSRIEHVKVQFHKNRLDSKSSYYFFLLSNEHYLTVTICFLRNDITLRCGKELRKTIQQADICLTLFRQTVK